MATLNKYPVPFTVHIGRALAVLEQLDTLTGVTLAAGHGVHLADPRAVLDANRSALLVVIDATAAALGLRSMDEAEATQHVCQMLGEGLAAPVSYYLARTTVQAALVFLYEQKRAVCENVGAGRMVWRVT